MPAYRGAEWGNVSDVRVTVRVNDAGVQAVLGGVKVREWLAITGEVLTESARGHTNEDTGDLRASMAAHVEFEPIRAPGGQFAAGSQYVLKLGSFGRPQADRTDNPNPDEVPYAVFQWAGWTDRGGNWHEGTHSWTKAIAELGGNVDAVLSHGFDI